ncbi:asparagine synthase (glutamine-hydrolyzing) [Endozoicomonas sp. Mp262]|uniref:asparagine synthase (glutamine-hydrolyzing) n=1 Tax=Endozoicomonas sp. Mp262 TaxID=2919499 RepID=UPI0021D90F24
MCGILGYFSATCHLPSKNQFKTSLMLQQHRGPDSYGIYDNNEIMLGHVRLSIIDLDNHANQPMICNKNEVILVFNGEIYNYLEIKQELIKKGYLFSTNSDTEVLLNSYIEYGISFIEKLIGMFSFAIYDKRKGETFIVRDRLGIKPLYFTQPKENTIIFSSEIKSILSLSSKKREIDLSAISSYLSFRYPILNNTFFKDINSLKPGCYIHIKNNAIQIKKYWSLSDNINSSVEHEENYYIDKIKELISSSVRYRMISDVPIGAYLSGGVDSSIITSIMAKNSSSPIKTFTIGFDEENYNELKYAKIVADQYNTTHHEIILTADQYIDTMDQLISYKDAPLGVPNEVPLYLMSKELKKHITVVLSGEGADEIFGGYGRIFRSSDDYNKINDPNNRKNSDFIQKVLTKYGTSSFDSELDHFLNIYSYTPEELKSSLFRDKASYIESKNRLINHFKNIFKEIEDQSYLTKMLYSFENVHLQGLLQRVDTTTMAASVEARVPFVDHRLVEFAFSIPNKYKIKWKNNIPGNINTLLGDEISEIYDTPKYILKKSYQDSLNKEILYRKKMGFPVPLHNWLGGNFKKYATSILTSKSSLITDFINRETIIKMIENPILKTSHGHAMKVWMLINIELFLRKYF